MDSGAQKIFNGKEDSYGGVVVNLMEMEPMDAQDFEAKLDNSLKAWKDQGKKGIWIKLSSKLSSLVDTAIKRGFTYHNAEKDYVMLHIGISAFVLNKSKEGEGIWAGAVREMEEETGIETKFVEVLAFRESHQSFLEEKTDIFFLCELKPSNIEIKKQDSEILYAKWMPIDEYVNQPFNQEKELFRYMANICLKRSKEKEKYAGFSTVLTTTASGKESYLYCRTDHDNLLNGECDEDSTSLFQKCFCFT
ncbi:LOW QUALITY PROTEIN: nudix hydrolase 6 [Eutrema salsugineum]|uniref:LOW QUALITY PROTEIN: nudix hydrolase 6 n=1 Tax=Eutrema salsugineum TaxID=72664 RepID=UPI000CED2327|nr:LOW QUALITY PROTEIN: nudix hydrolase 6 [Eutrema salsugineum]